MFRPLTRVRSYAPVAAILLLAYYSAFLFNDGGGQALYNSNTDNIEVLVADEQEESIPWNSALLKLKNNSGNSHLVRSQVKVLLGSWKHWGLRPITEVTRWDHYKMNTGHSACDRPVLNCSFRI